MKKTCQRGETAALLAMAERAELAIELDISLQKGARSLICMLLQDMQTSQVVQWQIGRSGPN
jgi:hypothetical protein